MERKLFASPWLRAVICNSKMVRDEIKARFGLPDERLPVIYNAVDSVAFHPGLRESRAAARPVQDSRRGDRVPAGRLGLRAQGRGDGDRRAGGTARAARISWSSAAKSASAATSAWRASLGVRERITFAGSADGREAVLRRRRRLRAADDLRSVPERGAGGDGVRRCRSSPARSPAPRSSWTEHDAGLGVRVARRGRARGAHAHAARCRRARAGWARTRAARSSR